jgi:hypothetical protein
MTRHSAAPPHIAEWLVSLVASPEQTAVILGDLLEEFSAIVSRSGYVFARRWYWGQSVRTITHLLASQVRHAPRESVAFTIGGFALYILAERALHVSAETFSSHTRVYFYLSAAPYWSVVTAVEQCVVPIMVGWTIARAARSREIVVALSVATTVTIWTLAFYTSWLLATADVASIYVPDLSMKPMFYDVHSAGRHAASFSNTLTHLRLTLIYWWMPTIVMLVIGAVIRRAVAMGQTRRNQTAYGL